MYKYVIFDNKNEVDTKFTYKEAIDYVCELEDTKTRILRQQINGVTVVDSMYEPIVSLKTIDIISSIIKELFYSYEDMRENSTDYTQEIFTTSYKLFHRMSHNSKIDFELSKCIKYMKDTCKVIKYAENLSNENYTRKMQRISNKADAIITLLLLEYGGKF